MPATTPAISSASDEPENVVQADARIIRAPLSTGSDRRDRVTRRRKLHRPRGTCGLEAMPRCMVGMHCRFRILSGGRPTQQRRPVRGAVPYQRERGEEHTGAGTGFVAASARRRRNARAPGTARNRPCRCRVMACSRVPCPSSRSMYGTSAAAASFGERKGSVFAEHIRIDRDQPPRLLIGGASHHHAVDMREMRARLFKRADAAVDDHRQTRMRRLEPIDALHSRAAAHRGFLSATAL